MSAQVFLIGLIAVLMSSCSSSSNENSSSDVNNDAEAFLSGTVIDALSSAPLNDVAVSLASDSTVTAFSSPDGSFRIGPIRPSDDLFRFALPGFREELMARPSLGNPVPPVALIPQDNAGVGGASGTVTNLNGVALNGVLLNFIEGINITDGAIAGSATTDANGSWTVTQLPYGNYTCIIFVPGNDPIVETIQILGGIIRQQQNVVAQTTRVPPQQTTGELGPNDVRIEVNWNSNSEQNHVLIRDDGSEINSDSEEFTSGAIVFVPHSGRLPQVSSITLQRSLLTGLTYSIRKQPSLVGLSIGFLRARVTVTDQTGILATFTAPEDRLNRWDVFKFEGGVPAEILNQQ